MLIKKNEGIKDTSNKKSGVENVGSNAKFALTVIFVLLF